MRHLFYPFALGVLTCSALAQSSAPMQSGPVGREITPTIFSPPQSDPASCPVGFSAERRAATVIALTGDTAPAADSQVVRVRFDRLANRQLRSADVLVHGVSLRAQFAPAGSSANPDLNRSFHLGNMARDRTPEKDLVLPHAGGIQSVDLLALHFTDGSSWQAGSASPCRAVPDLYLPVAD